MLGGGRNVVGRQRVVDAALRDRRGDLLERFAALVREVERDDRLALLVEVLLRVADVGARQRRVVLDDPVAVGLGRVRAGLLVAHDEDALGDLEHLGVRPLLLAEVLERGLARVRRSAVVVRLLGLLVERVEARGVGGVVVAVDLRLALGGLLDGVVEARDRLTAVGVLVRVRLAVLVEDVGFPVVEEQLGGGADLLRGALGVLDARQVDLDLRVAGLQQLRLGDAEGVDALAHDLQRALERLLRDGRLLGRRLALVDELDAALEVEAELGVLLRDDVERPGDQAEDDQQDEERAAAFGH